ncbi:MAG: hypothetical protein ACK4UU_04315 [Fimbriimonadales bacterium]
MRPYAKKGLLGLGIVILALLLVRWLRADAPNRFVQLKDGSTVRLLQITRGTTHTYTPPRWREWLERIGWTHPSQGIKGARFTSAQPEVWVWLHQRIPSANPNSPWGIALPRMRFVDSQGAYLPAQPDYFTLIGSPTERIFVVRLPRLPSSERQVWLEFLDESKRRRLLVPPPYVGISAPPLKPQPLPARFKTQEFEYELQRLAIVSGGVWIIEEEEYPLLQIEPRSRFYENGKPSNNWVITEYWLEDPYGNRYDPTRPPPWHYPYWLFCATVHPSSDAPLNPERAWRSRWISRRRGADTPVQATIRQSGVVLDLLGVFEYPQLVLQVDSLSSNQYQVVSHSHKTPRNQQGHSVSSFSHAGKVRWDVQVEPPFLIARIRLPLAATSWQMGKDGAFIFNDQAIYIFLQDERGRLSQALPVLFSEGADNTSLLAVWNIDPTALADQRFRVIVDIRAPRKIRLPIAPLDKAQVLKLWSPEATSR